MLGSKKPTYYRDQRNTLRQKYAIVRDHFMCEFILTHSGFDSIHDYVKGATVPEWRPVFPKVKSGALTKASKKFGCSLDTVNRVWQQCLRMEWQRQKTYENDYNREFICLTGNNAELDNPSIRN